MYETLDTSNVLTYRFIRLGAPASPGLVMDLCKSDGTNYDDEPVNDIVFGPGFVGSINNEEAMVGLNIIGKTTGGQTYIQVAIPPTCGPVTVDWLGMLINSIQTKSLNFANYFNVGGNAGAVSVGLPVSGTNGITVTSAAGSGYTASWDGLAVNGAGARALSFPAKFSVTVAAGTATIDLPITGGTAIRVTANNPGVTLDWTGGTVNGNTDITDIEFNSDFTVNAANHIANVAWAGMSVNSTTNIKSLTFHSPDFNVSCNNGNAQVIWNGLTVQTTGGVSTLLFSTTNFGVSIANGTASVVWNGMQINTFGNINEIDFDATCFNVTKSGSVATVAYDGKLSNQADVSIYGNPSNGALLAYKSSTNKWTPTGGPGNNQIPKWTSSGWTFVDLPGTLTVAGDNVWTSASTTSGTTTVSHIGPSTATQSVAVITGLSVSGKSDCYDPWTISYTVTNLNFDAHGHFVNTTSGSGGSI